nr:FxsA family protein [uncultured Bacillus sp.]
MRILLLLLITIPAAEIGILLFSGKMIGVLPTVLMIIFTGILGAVLAKKQGLKTIRKANEQLQYGRVPGDEMMDGLCIVIGGIFLLTPGFLTDLLGILLLLPPTRSFMKPLMMKMLQRWMDKNTFTIIR